MNQQNKPPEDERDYNDDACTVWSIFGALLVIMIIAGVVVSFAH